MYNRDFSYNSTNIGTHTVLMSETKKKYQSLYTRISMFSTKCRPLYAAQGKIRFLNFRELLDLVMDVFEIR